MTKKLVPALRFKGFDEEWEEKIFVDLCNIGNGRDYKHLGIGNIPVYGTGGYMLSVNKALCEVDSIGIGRKGTIDKPYVLKAPFWTVDTLFYCVPKACFVDFLIGVFNNIDWKQKDESTGVPSLSKKTIEETTTSVPSLSEQHKIGNFMSNMDKRIAEQRRKIEKLKNFKKALLSKLFPAMGVKVPALRFKGFEGEWEKRKLGEIGKCHAGIAFPECEQGGSCGIPFYKVSDMNIKGNEKHLVVANNYVSKEQVKNNNWKVLNDVPAIFFAKVGAAVFLNRKRIIKECCLMDNNTMAFVHDNKHDCNFIKEIFDKINMLDFVQVGALPSFNSSDVEGHSVMITMVKLEQKKIGSLMANLDNVVELQAKILIKLQNMKQACLQKMFV